MADELLKLGPYRWIVLRQTGDAMLLVTSGIIEQRAYHGSKVPVTWETCTVRRYLNEELWREAFSYNERQRVLLTCVENADNQWFNTPGGNETEDRLFLLSLAEVVTLFGDSGQLVGKNPRSKLFINDSFKQGRIAMRGATRAHWWLRSPGLRETCAADVFPGGAVHVGGHHVTNVAMGGIRPALWLRV
ncbi:MAG: DUF6273 domain-containing protein [Coriobacteriales bacterium]|jgi:hypothetical protein|nr:DUF6273 domain-containing protein [Coriobacteriales bacterium]